MAVTKKLALVAALVVVTGSVAAVAQGASDEPDLAMYGRIRDEGLSRSRVMDFAFELMDRIGARLSGSPNLDRAVSWAVDRLTQAGLDNVRRDRWGEFGMQWRQRNTWVTLVEPDLANLQATAAPWSPPTRGPVTGEVVYVRGFTDEKEFPPLRGTLKGKVVLLGRAPRLPEVTPIRAAALRAFHGGTARRAGTAGDRHSARRRCGTRAELFTATWTIRRRSCARMTSTKSRRQVTVGTTKKSAAATCVRWLVRNVRQVCDGGRVARHMYFATVGWLATIPSFRSSP